MNSIPKFVVSTTLTKVEWNNSRLLREISLKMCMNSSGSPVRTFWLPAAESWEIRCCSINSR